MTLLPPICDFQPFEPSRVSLLRQARMLVMAKLAEAGPKRIVGITTKNATRSKLPDKSILGNLTATLDTSTQRMVLEALAKIKKK